MRIHHLGYLVKKIDKAIKAFEALGYSITQQTILDEYRQANICFLEKDGYVVELVSPVSKESVVADLIKRLGNSPYHFCYVTDCIEDDISRLQEQHYVMCSELHSAVALNDKRVCFLIHPYLGMIELLEA